MKIPKYWAKGVARVKGERGEFDLTLWRWSDTSQVEASQAAEARAREVASRFTSFRDLDRYGYAERPLREEIVEALKDGGNRESAVITRNSYGALVLNAARIMFIDMDFDEKATAGRSLLGRLTGHAASPQEAPYLARLEVWTRQHPQWSLRVYRTFGGLRGLITNELFEPADPGSTEILQSLNSDPLYVKLCRAQECFRARLTPKPWRCGTANPPSRYPWPTSAVEIAQRQWERQYQHAADRYSTCKLIKEFGSAPMHSEVARIVEIHDRYTCRGDNFDLA